VLVVGIGGLGCPAAWVLARAGVGTIGIADDDVVDGTNLHRQILFTQADVGAPKLEAARRALAAMAPDVEVRLHPTRLLPHNAVDLVARYDVVLEGSDNFATKFLTADACAIARIPVVHAAAVRWIGTALAVGARGRPCYRCLFEDLPSGDAPNCAEAGVMGPVVGVVAAAQADLALALLDQDSTTRPQSGGRALGARVEGVLVTYDGRADAFRRRTIPARANCPLCGDAPRIRTIEPDTYLAPAPATCAS
jgi:adenylyltransferase/sulfurtransferase